MKLTTEDILELVDVARSEGKSADFSGQDLSLTGLDRAELKATNFAGCNLRGVNSGSV